MKTRFHLYLLIILLSTGAIVVTPASLFAHSPDRSFSIQAEPSLISLAEGWIHEFQKYRPDAVINLVHRSEDTDSPLVRLFEHPSEHPEGQADNVILEVGQIALLPIINESNPHFVKEQKKGVRINQLRELFFVAEEGNPQGHEFRKPPEYEIYSPVPRSVSALAFSSFFERSPEDLNGIYVTGDDSHLLRALIQDSAGISYAKLPLIYNPETREPLSGIKVLPLDLNNNGRLDKHETIFGNLDQILRFAENSGKPNVPVIRVSLSTSPASLVNPDVEEFINWIGSEGQRVNIQLGFLMGGESRIQEFTQK